MVRAFMNHDLGAGWGEGCPIEIERPVKLGIRGETGVEVGGSQEVQGK